MTIKTLVKILTPLLLISLVFTIGCEDGEDSGIDIEAGNDVSGDIIQIDGDGNSVQQNTVEEEIFEEEE
jgi:Fe-S cluster assembly ATPase SufC